ncbi:TonB-dependent receptor [Aestuariicella sp. G3-2]|uniref:TonB-dependent receptor n=1 Tax=Pseudomaricurvus albidus TaxID=2842452 RepID=UPI001C0E44C9|nr:TonB-dependent receptor [Aestuariicella albida]MBU3071299.1 TonB-dependent receptor [Aestuariicella albida]
MKITSQISRLALTGTIATLGLPSFADNSSYAIEEVIVTAQKKAESMQDVPLSVSALSSNELGALKLHDSTEIAAQVPNVQVATPYSDSQPAFSVRGVSMSDFSQNQSSPIAMYVNEVYKGVGALQALQLFDLERIEVLRGPQGTLYGKNATGGAVNIISKTPELDGITLGDISFGIGNFNRKETNGAVEISDAENAVGARLAFTYAESDGWIENKLPAAEDPGAFRDYALRLTGRYQPTDNLDVVLRVSKSRSTQDNGYEVYATNIGSGGVGFFTGYERTGLDFFESEIDRQDGNSLDNNSTSVTINWDINDELTLTSVTSYDEGDWVTREDGDGSPFNILHIDFGSEVTSIAQDLRLSSAFVGNFNFLLGLYGNREDLDATMVQRMYYAFAGDNDASGTLDCFEDFITGCRLSNSYNQVKTSLAAYFQGSYDISPDLSFTLGLRFTKDKNEIKDYRADLGYLDPATNTEIFSAMTTINNHQDEVTDRNWGTRFALDYALTSDITSYISFTTGYRGSAFNGQAYFDVSEITTAEPEEVDAWEVGFKSDLLDNRLRINGAIFHYAYENQQFLDVTPNFLQVLVNADRSTVQGAELEVTAIPHPVIDVRMGLGYLDAKYDKLELRGLDLSGNDLINAPSLNFNAMINWRLLEMEAGHVTLTLDTSYTGDQYFDAFNNENTRQEAYWLTNMRMGFQTQDEQLEIAVWVKNLTDEEYTSSILDLQELFNFDYAHRGRTRTLGVDASYRF